MKEVLAENLLLFFANSGIDGKCTYSGDIYEVWEVSDKDFETMSNMSEEEFIKLCPSGMWRSADGSNMGIPYVKYTINGKKIIAWDRLHEDESRIKRRYDSLLEYMCEEIGASQPRNVCALAVDLAKYNNMTMGELFAKYEG